MEDFEIIETIKGSNPNCNAFAAIWGDRILVKSKIPRWRNFPAHIQPIGFIEDYNRAKNFKIYEDDIWIIGYPRSGTTMLQELVWIVANDFNIEGAMKADTFSRAPYFEFWNSIHKFVKFPSDHIEKLPRPRVFKTHTPVQFLPDQMWSVKPRIIHVSRDIKDVAISFYHFRKNVLTDDAGTMEEHFEEILNDETWWCPYRQHLMNYQNLPDYNNICYITYEELLNDLDGSIRKIALFLDKKASDENVEILKIHMSIQNMRKNKMTNVQAHLQSLKENNPHDGQTDTYIRKGIIGDYKTVMSAETIAKFNKWMADSKNITSPWCKN